MLDTVEAYAPGFKASVIARQSLSPLDLERILGLAQWRYLSWRYDTRSAVFCTPDAWICRLPHADRWTLFVWRRCASGRRRDRRAGAQRSTGGDRRSVGKLNIVIGYSNHSTHRNCSDIAQISG